uniref:Uncharacterized protein n=2 Tax=Pseudomonas fluorescens TaxID=294 RepID=A0A0G4E4S9_PSEFS|nr:hypothetical protein PQBR57_0298 [Pseudomonas fluorescens SBW25]
MGFGTGQVTLELTGFDGHRGGSTIHLDQPTDDLDAVISYLERRIIVLFAGALAEALSPVQTPQKGIDQARASEIFLSPNLGSGDDHTKVREALMLLRNIHNVAYYDKEEVHRQMTDIGNRLWARASELVEQFEDTIVGLACSLTQTLEVTGAGQRQTISGYMSEETLSGLPGVQALPLLEP